MTQRKPPALASWMLRHLVLGDRTESLEGDLLEEFHKGRSAAWYWRQEAPPAFRERVRIHPCRKVMPFPAA